MTDYEKPTSMTIGDYCWRLGQDGRYFMLDGANGDRYQCGVTESLLVERLAKAEQDKMPFGYVSHARMNRDANGRVAVEWPEDARGSLISRELLDQMVEEANDMCWIPVDERLPPDDQDVLLTDGEEVVQAWFEGEDGWTAWHTSDNWRGAKAWMPLPGPPRK